MRLASKTASKAPRSLRKSMASPCSKRTRVPSMPGGTRAINGVDQFAPRRDAGIGEFVTGWRQAVPGGRDETRGEKSTPTTSAHDRASSKRRPADRAPQIEGAALARAGSAGQSTSANAPDRVTQARSTGPDGHGKTSASSP